MPPVLSTENEQNLNRICEEYLRILDKYQQDVYNIRIIHHVIWRALRPLTIVLHHRAGSRVERQLRMLPPNGASDVDYKFEVSGVHIDASKSETSNMYFKSSCECEDARNAYGVLYAPSSLKTFLASHDQYKPIFEKAFTRSLETSNDDHILLPNIFKENVVKECGFQTKQGSQKKSSPSIAVQGAKNETDAVPCLKLTTWTQEAMLWVSRNPVNPMFCSKWKKKIVDTVPLYVVPTGNRRSPKSDMEWRLSFVFVEKACFDRIAECKPRIRHLFGLVKFVFKCFLDDLDIFSSYHLKTLLFWKCESKTPENWDNIKPLAFIIELLEDMEKCLTEKNIKQFFLPDCNIFPFDKMDVDRVTMLRKRFFTMKKEMVGMIKTTISFDLGVDETLVMKNWIREIDGALKIKTEQGVKEGYISGYLTRLHSMTSHSLLENHTKGTLKTCVRALENILLDGQEDSKLCDVLVKRIIPMLAPQIHALSQEIYINSGFCQFRQCTESLHSQKEEANKADIDQIANIRAFDAFEQYLKKDFVLVKTILDTVMPMLKRERCIGLTLSKLHSTCYLDHVLLFVMSHMEANGVSTNRVFIEPNIMLAHLNIQLEIQSDRDADRDSLHPRMMDLLTQLYSLVSSSSVREPYIGSLSYKHIGTVMLMGYQDFFANRSSSKMLCPFPEVPSETLIVNISKVRNFDLR
ncbi:uncharacterized protein LOC110449322 [Mizuhopecten yessoensis]|uniref:uncharacterized protein LOC110449322 n=1 Tax=Mizuhopecten yessoensis TaxID=6573 RepID=UPI000B457987|nr:uncharacterized protein LOC110449322 [Mizuhopecten yessoensis]